MKLAFLSSCFILLSTAAVAHAAPKPTAEEEKVRAAIDDICGDTWCEGDWQYDFRRVVMNQKTHITRVIFTMNWQGQDLTPQEADGYRALVHSYNVECQVTGFSAVDQVMENDRRLNRAFYDKLTDCIGTLERRLSTP